MTTDEHDNARRDRVIKTSMTDAEAGEIAAAATTEGLDVAAYLRRCALMAARARRGRAAIEREVCVDGRRVGTVVTDEITGLSVGRLDDSRGAVTIRAASADDVEHAMIDRVRGAR